MKGTFGLPFTNELICSQFIDKQIYGNSELDVFIKKGFKTNEEINIRKTLVPAYLAFHDVTVVKQEELI